MGSSDKLRHVLVLGDSLTFQGPQGIVAPTNPQLFPNLAAAQIAVEFGSPMEVDLVAREGWTSRDAWWALTKDPVAFGTYLPRASAVIIAVGGMDQLPAVIPTYLREGMPYLRPGGVRRRTRQLYRDLAPKIVRATGGLMRQLPQSATDRYLTRIVQAVRAISGDIPIVAMTPSPYDSAYYPSQKYHDQARVSAFSWAACLGVPIVDIENPVLQGLSSGAANPDGMHWSWHTHEWVGSKLAGELTAAIRR
ncbi:MAG: SGNH/GDSL hydrolase family protein [Actinomycetales bacterium]|jgi:diglucosylglycerate octanoyltransferase|nr:SGNH/GDSL hydrolase family protein [Actinomycetales bacterium]